MVSATNEGSRVRFGIDLCRALNPLPSIGRPEVGVSPQAQSQTKGVARSKKGFEEEEEESVAGGNVGKTGMPAVIVLSGCIGDFARFDH